MKKKILVILIVLILIITLGILYYQNLYVRTFIGVAAPTKEDCDLCGDPRGEKSYVTYKIRGHDIIDIKFDTYLPKVGSKIKYSKSGEYKIADDPDGGGIAWHEHVEKLENYIIKNDKFPKLDKDGYDADNVSGATIKIEELDNAFKKAKPAKEVKDNKKYINLFTDELPDA